MISTESAVRNIGTVVVYGLLAGLFAWILYPILRLLISFTVMHPEMRPYNPAAATVRYFQNGPLNGLWWTIAEDPFSPLVIMGANWFTFANMYLPAAATPISIFVGVVGALYIHRRRNGGGYDAGGTHG